MDDVSSSVALLLSGIMDGTVTKEVLGAELMKLSPGERGQLFACLLRKSPRDEQWLE